MGATITVDHRERAPLLLARLQDLHGFAVQYQQLPWGDYLVPPDTVVERKTSRDFIVSILDGRLFKQAYGLVELESNLSPVLLLEGPELDAAALNVTPAAVKGALVTLAQTFRLPVLRSADEQESAWFLARLHAQRRRLGQNSGVLRGYKPKRAQTRKLQLLRALPGVGPKLAAQLLETFGSVAAVMAATPAELAAIDGIGTKKAATIVELLR